MDFLRPTSLLLAGCFLFLGAHTASAQGVLEVHLIDVDQGLSVLAIGPTGTSLLIDGGNPGQGLSIVRPYLQAQGLTDLDYGLVTHYHTDHMGGIDEVFNNGFKPLLAALDRGNTNMPSNGEVTQYLNSVSGVRQTAVIGQTIALGGGATLQVTTVNGQHLTGSVNVAGSSQEENSRSISVVIRYGDFDLYVGGDLTGGGNGTSDVEGPASVPIGQVEVVVAAHHGSWTSSNAQAVASFNPSLVLYACGQDNPYGHPSTDVVGRWNTLAGSRVQWCSTDGDTSNGTGGFLSAEGHVAIESDGASFTVSRASGDAVTFATFEQPGPSPSAGQLAVTELLVDPQQTSDSLGEWFEIVSLWGSLLDLGGMRFTSGAATFTLVSRILVLPGQRAVFASDGRESLNGEVFPVHTWPWSTFPLANSSSSLAIKTPSNSTLETVSWGSGGFPVVAGRSAERISSLSPPIPANFATSSAAWAGGDKGSPGAINAAELPDCQSPSAYGTGKLTSQGLLPAVGWLGVPSLFGNDFQVFMTKGIPNQAGVGFWGLAQASTPFYGGTLWVEPPLTRLAVQLMDPFGVLQYDLPIDGSMVGQTRYYQFWFRDPAHPDGTTVGLSNALAVPFCTH
jgi:competence protein ComEC